MSTPAAAATGAPDRTQAPCAAETLLICSQAFKRRGKRGVGSGRQELDTSSLSRPPAPLPGHCLPLVSLGHGHGPRDPEGAQVQTGCQWRKGTPRRSHLLGEAGWLQPLQASGATVSLEGKGWTSAPGPCRVRGSALCEAGGLPGSLSLCICDGGCGLVLLGWRPAGRDKG